MNEEIGDAICETFADLMRKGFDQDQIATAGLGMSLLEQSMGKEAAIQAVQQGLTSIGYSAWRN